MSQIEQAVEVLKRGGIIAYPTDTVYGIGCNIFDKRAVKKLLKLKGRDFDKPLSVAVADLKMLKKLAVVGKEEQKILKKFLPGPFTFILAKRPVVDDLITAGLGRVGLRIPDNNLAREIIKKAGFPIITTSANEAGKKPAVSCEQVDLAVDFVLKGECKHKQPSTVVDLENKKIIRKGVGDINFDED